MEALQSRSWLDPELLDERLPGMPVRRQGLDLATGAVERQHQLTSNPLTERIPHDEAFELTDERLVLAKFEVGVDPRLEQRATQLVEPRDLAVRERLVRELGERLAAPQRERFAHEAASLRGRRRLERGDELVEPADVHLPGIDVECVPGRTRHDVLAPERLPQRRDHVLERRGRRPGRLPVPEHLEQRVGRDHPIGVQQQQGEQNALLLAAERQLAAVCVGDLERAEQPKIEHASDF